MPWTKEDAKRHTKKIFSAKSAREWKDVANSILARTGDEGRAIRGANSVVKKRRTNVRRAVTRKSTMRSGGRR